MIRQPSPPNPLSLWERGRKIIGSVLLLFFVVSPQFAADQKRFDERGNLITESAAAAALPSKALLEGTKAKPETAEPTQPASVKPLAADAAEAAREEAEALAQQKNPLTKAYLENAQMYLRSARADKALEFLKKSQEAGEDTYSREAKLTALYLRARRGDAGLEGEAEGMDEKLKAQALLRIADGYQTCAREQLKKPECLGDAERIYAFISELQPRASEGKLARLRLGLLLVDAGRLEAALPHLTQTLMAEGDTGPGQARELPFDRAWYNLGQLYERPWYHRDTHKAEVAYKQVLKYAGSPYQQAARERLQHISRFGTGYSRP